MPANQASVALHRSALAAARGHLHACVDSVWNKTVNAESVSLQEISAVWGAAMHAARIGRETLEAMFSVAGTTSLYTHCPLERAHRDLHAMLRHVVVQPHWLEDAGRVMFELEPQQPLFAL
jgi:alkylation response protein AidB-like acyl-CoA dehydrogenase